MEGEEVVSVEEGPVEQAWPAGDPEMGMRQEYLSRLPGAHALFHLIQRRLHETSAGQISVKETRKAKVREV